MGTVETFLVVVPVANGVSAVGGAGVRALGVAAIAETTAGKYLLADLTFKVGERTMTRLLSTAGGQAFITSYNKFAKPVVDKTGKLFDDYVYQPKWNFTISGVKRAPITTTPIAVVDDLTMLSLREQYKVEVRNLRRVADDMLAGGVDKETVARTVHQMRRNLGIEYKNMTPPEELKRITDRNVKQYGDPLGPSFDFLRNQNKSFDDIINSACSPGGKDLGPGY